MKKLGARAWLHAALCLYALQLLLPGADSVRHAMHAEEPVCKECDAQCGPPKTRLSCAGGCPESDHHHHHKPPDHRGDHCPLCQLKITAPLLPLVAPHMAQLSTPSISLPVSPRRLPRRTLTGAPVGPRAPPRHLRRVSERTPEADSDRAPAIAG